jgi:glycosyltransferase involved in cell wall biosynthesis
VCLDLWPYTYDSRCEAFTTVTDWWSGFVTEIVNGRQVMYDNNKRVSFLAFAELPRLTDQPLELAVYLAGDDTEDRQTMERHGWRFRHSLEVSRTPEMYRSYIQRSRGEISCVKPSYVRLRNGWISDRSLCYLASGKPVVVQRTNLDSYLPSGEGLFQFSTATEAAEALAIVNADYEKHCRSAREIAENYFDARRTAERILGVALP